MSVLLSPLSAANEVEININTVRPIAHTRCLYVHQGCPSCLGVFSLKNVVSGFYKHIGLGACRERKPNATDKSSHQDWPFPKYFFE